jgi:hypothetical protein
MVLLKEGGVVLVTGRYICEDVDDDRGDTRFLAMPISGSYADARPWRRSP